MSNFCTISTVSHLHKTFALADSLSPFGGILNVLLVDGTAQTNLSKPANVQIYSLDIFEDEIAKKIIAKYSHKDKLRWALKSVFLKFLLGLHSKVIYVDNDIFFFNDFSFLFEKLNTKSVLLTPHFYEANPEKNQNWLEANFRVGLYNAGFIGANSEAIPILDWWEKCCLYNMKKSYLRGLFDDQKYLDLVPVLFDNIEIVKHRGCNLAGWNHKTYADNNQHDKDNLVFIHFAELSLIEFSKPNSRWHNQYTYYSNALKKYSPDYEFRKNIFSIVAISNFVYFLGWKFYRLFEKN